MAFASVGTLGTSQEKTSDTSLVLTTTATLESGNFALLFIALDNIATTDGDHSEVSSVTDAASNTWQKIAEYTNGQGLAGDGVTVALWGTLASSQLNSGSNITITTSGNTTAKTASAWEFTIGGSGVTLASSVIVGLNDGADAAAVTLSGLTSKEYLFVHALGVESTLAGVSYVEDADYTSVSSVATSGSGAATNIAVFGGFRILTGTGDTVDVSTAARDSVQIYVALQETTGGTTYNQSADGGLTPSGTVSRSTSKSAAGGLTPAGTAVRATAKSAAGGLTPSGALGAVRTFLVSLAGSIIPSGALARLTAKSAVGSFTPTGALTRLTAKTAAGGLTPSGTLAAVRTFLVSLAGSLTPSGALARLTGKSAAGSLTPAGTAVRSTSKSTAGGIAPSGTVARLTAKAAVGALGLAGVTTRHTSKSLAGSITPAGGIVKLIGLALAGLVALAGSLLVNGDEETQQGDPEGLLVVKFRESRIFVEFREKRLPVIYREKRNKTE